MGVKLYSVALFSYTQFVVMLSFLNYKAVAWRKAEALIGVLAPCAFMVSQ